VTVHFNLKDAGRTSLAEAVGDILVQDALYTGTPDFTRSVGGYIVHCSTRQTSRKGIASLNIRFNVSSAGRRAFANAVGEILGLGVVYNRTPTFSYSIGSYTLDRNGALTFPNDIFHRESIDLIMALMVRGYEVETDGLPDFHTLQMPESEEPKLGYEHPIPYDNNEKLTLHMPKEGFTDTAIANLRKIVAGKESVIKKALGTESLQIEETEDMLRFPWFTLTGASGEIDAYLRFVTAICQMAKRQKRVTTTEREVENDKFAFRVFLVRLGFVGPEFKVARKILLRNLTGNSSWKSGRPTD